MQPIQHNFELNANYSQAHRSEKSKNTQTFDRAFFKKITQFLSFPARYLGSKTWSFPELILGIPARIAKIAKSLFSQTPSSVEIPLQEGYHHTMRPMEPEHTLPFLAYGATTLCADKINPDWLSPWRMKVVSPNDIALDTQAISPSLEKRSTCFFNPKTSLKATIIESDLEIIIVFGALNAGNNELPKKRQQIYMKLQQILFIAANLFGFKLGLFKEADKFYRAMRQLPQFQHKPFVTTGLCWGGAIAQYTALKNKSKAVCFNCFPLGVGHQEEIGRDRLNNADHHITHITAKNDFTSDLPCISWIDKPLSVLLGLRTPGNFGRRYVIPSAYDKMTDIHRFIMGSLLKHLGYHTRAKAHEISSDHIILPAHNDEFEMQDLSRKKRHNAEGEWFEMRLIRDLSSTA